jgi:hypothetical protein
MCVLAAYLAEALKNNNLLIGQLSKRKYIYNNIKMFIKYWHCGPSTDQLETVVVVREHCPLTDQHNNE